MQGPAKINYFMSLSTGHYPSVMFVGGDSLNSAYHLFSSDSAIMVQSKSAKYCYRGISNIGKDNKTVRSGHVGKVFL